MGKRAIRLLGISGSPRAAATDYAIREALRYAEEKYDVETEYFSVAKKKIQFCTHCDFCVQQKKGCVFQDDMLEVYQLLQWADAYIIGSPVYQGNISGQLKTLFDRTRAILVQNIHIFDNKVGAGIAVGGDRSGGQEPTLRTIHDFYIINHIFSVGGGAFGANLGASFWSKDKGAKGAEMDKRGLKALYRTMDQLILVAQKLCD
ncbi:MAG: flavodoxin family protein [Candidatus Hodarchaeota archaeon]